MPPVTRLTDSTTGTCDPGLPCCPHSRSGTNQVVSPDTFANSLNIHRRTDTGPCNCPHSGTFRSVEASSTVFVNCLGVTRIGDMTVCIDCQKSGNHVSGSPNVIVGG